MPILSDEDRKKINGRAGGGRRRRSRRKSRRGALYLAVSLALFSAAAVILLLFFRSLSRENAQLADNKDLTINAGKRGAIELLWNPASHTSGYRVEIYDPDGDGEPLISKFSRKARCVLSKTELASIPADRAVKICITARDLLYFINKDEAAEAAETEYLCCLNEPEIADCTGSIDIASQSIELKWVGWDADTYTIYLRDNSGSRAMVREISSAGGFASPMSIKEYDVTVPYGQRGDFKIPRDDEIYTLEMEVARESDNVLFQGQLSEILTVSRLDLMSRKIELVCDRLEDNRYRLSWNDTGSFAYRVEILRPGAEDFEIMGTVPGSESLIYETPEHLRAGREYTFRVTSVSEQDVVSEPIDRAFADIYGTDEAEGTGVTEDADAGILTVFTEESTLFANIWPTKNLELYADTDKAAKIGTASLGSCLCVLSEDKDNWLFRVRVGDDEGYIDSRYCMINLPDYLGDYCQYDIPNSYASIYMVNDYYIPEVTAEVIPGYEDILLDDDTFIVPLLYPVAIKLLDAAEATLKDGYRIEINDSFRPHCATRNIYDQTNKVLNWRLPDIKYWGYRTSFDIFLQNRRSLVEAPGSVYPGGGSENYLPQGGDESGEDGALMGEDVVMELAPEEVQVAGSEEQRNTYYWEMTKGSYRLGSFLAAVASRHNIGVAMDMTLVDVADDYRHLEMQTNMHNLSWYSAMSRNNGNADILKGYLTEAGFGMISSEWWHFQDNDVTAELNPPVVENGVNIEGWKLDDHGWHYRGRKGEYISNSSMDIDGRTYIFDEKGYTDR